MIVYLLLYVDDILLIRFNMHEINGNRKALSFEFGMKDLEHVERIPGIDIVRSRSKPLLILNQTSYNENYCRNFLCMSLNL